jgi:Fe-Mn family superoxide dismutase
MKKKELLKGVLLTPANETTNLPYSLNALEPYISEQTLYYHHGKHLAGYVNNTKRLQEGTDFQGKCIFDTMLGAKDALFNNAAQVYNHLFYFEQFATYEQGKNIPIGTILSAIEQQYGSFQNFKDSFAQAALSQFGSGWVWLVLTPSGELKIVKTTNAGNPIFDMNTPLFVIDVWEHAYYIDYKNDRATYIEKLWNIVDWDVVSQRLENATKILSI